MKDKSNFEKFTGIYCSGLFISNSSMLTSLCILFDQVYLVDNLEYVLVQLSYAIGLKNPLAIYITSDKGDLKVPEDLYEKCSVQNIINSLNFLNEKYEKRAMFGHFID